MGDSKKKGRGPGRTTRDDWIRVALDTLISDGEEQVKVLVLPKSSIARGRRFTGIFRTVRICWTVCWSIGG
ncbi:MAG: hypothetical protein AAFY25_08070 [Pseudomonadota bacterium]